MLGFLLNSPFIVAYKLGLIGNHVAQAAGVAFLLR